MDFEFVLIYLMIGALWYLGYRTAKLTLRLAKIVQKLAQNLEVEE